MLSLSDENFGKMVSGKTKAQNLFMSGKLKIKGNVMKGKSVLDVCCGKVKRSELTDLITATKMEPILAKAAPKAKL